MPRSSTFPSRGAVKEEDPSIYNVMRTGLVQALARIKQYKESTESQRKTALSDEERAQRQRAFDAFDEMWIDRFGALPASTKESTPQPEIEPKLGTRRKRRRQVDILLAEPRKEDEPTMRKRTRKERGISMRIDKEKDWWEAPYYG